MACAQECEREKTQNKRGKPRCGQMQSRAHEQRWCAHKRVREIKQRTRGANLGVVEMQSGAHEQRWRAHKSVRESKQRTRGANLGVVEVQSRAHEQRWCAHKERDRERS